MASHKTKSVKNSYTMCMMKIRDEFSTSAFTTCNIDHINNLLPQNATQCNTTHKLSFIDLAIRKVFF